MRVLFYYDPVPYRGDPLWRSDHVRADARALQGLRNGARGRRAECLLLMPERYRPALPLDVTASEVRLLEHHELLGGLAEPHLDLNRVLHRGELTREANGALAECVRDKLGGFVPDVIHTWTPVSFLRETFPDALVLHKERGMFQRAPFPATFYLDPGGVYDRSVIEALLPQILSRPAPEDALAGLAELRRHFCGLIRERSPFASEIARLRERFEAVVLLPLQYGGYYTFDGFFAGRTQSDLITHVLEQLPRDVALLITRHLPNEPNNESLRSLYASYDNFVFLPQTEHFANASDLLLPFVDAVASVTSSLALKALFFGKPTYHVGREYWRNLWNGEGLRGFCTAADPEQQAKQDRFLAWYLLAFSLPQHGNEISGWTHGLYERLWEAHRDRRLPDELLCYLESPTERVASLITHTDRNFPARDDRGFVASSVAALDASQLADLAAVLRGEWMSPAWQELGTVAGSPLRLLIVFAAGRYNASGFYLQDLAAELVGLGHDCLIAAEGELPPGGRERGVDWVRLDFDGMLLHPGAKKRLTSFAPDFIYLINIRASAMRAALEMHISTGACLAIQSEDDDGAVFNRFYAEPDPVLLQALDKPHLSDDDLRQFVSKLPLSHTLGILSGAIPYRDVEPLLRALCYHLASLHTAVWKPLADELAGSFAKPTLVVPPVVPLSRFDPTPVTPRTRARTLRKYGVDPERLAIFLGGTIYDFSPEFETFVRALSIAGEQCPLALVISGRSRVNITEIIDANLHSDVSVENMGVPDDEDYYAMVRSADVVAAPGHADNFNRLRLSSRLVKAMAFGKPIFTYRSGFGESLRDGHDAILTDSDNAEEWASQLLRLRDEALRHELGANGRLFAEQHFGAEEVARALASAMTTIRDGGKSRDGVASTIEHPPLVHVESMRQLITEAGGKQVGSFVLVDYPSSPTIDPALEQLLRELRGANVTLVSGQRRLGRRFDHVDVVHNRDLGALFSLLAKRHGCVVVFRGNRYDLGAKTVAFARVCRSRTGVFSLDAGGTVAPIDWRTELARLWKTNGVGP